MKNEDMMRLYNEGKIALKIELNKPVHLNRINILLIVFVLAREISPQIPINGFCKYNSFVTDSGFTGMFTTNFNKDSYTDLVLYNPNRKKILSLPGNQSGSFDDNKPYNMLSEISNIHSITNRNNRITGYVYSSRKSMKVGTFEFLKDGRMRTLNEIKFKSYPESISAADINGNGTNEILVTGSAFDGISVISFIDHKPVETNIGSRASYSRALFIDLSNDGLADISAVNLQTNSIDFFYNNGAGKFNLTRSISAGGKISFLKSFDMNLDYFEDLIFSTAGRIEILFGDPASSYEEKIVISTKFNPDKIITGDFNRDGKIDIVYLNYKEEIISTIFAKNDSEFYSEIIYMKKNSIKDIIPFYSKYINGIAALSSDGKIYTITNLTSFSNEVSISIGALPTAISWFDNDNNGITDISFIDSYDSKLKFILRNAAGIPSTYYSYPLYQEHSEIVVDNNLPNQKSFYCYSLDQRLIEAITVDFNLNKFSRHSLYSPGAIKDLKIKKEQENTIIYTTYLKNGGAGLSVITNHDFRFNSAEYPLIAKDISCLNISLLNTPAVYYWQTNKKEIVYSKFTAANKNSTEQIKASLPAGKINSISSFVGDLLNKESDVSISFLKAENKRYVIISSKDMTRILQNKMDKEFTDENGNIRIPDRRNFYFGEVRQNGLKKLTYYNPLKNTINRVDFINGGKNFITSRIADVEHMDDYFIRNMSYKKYHIVYTNLSDNCITVKEI